MLEENEPEHHQKYTQQNSEICKCLHNRGDEILSHSSHGDTNTPHIPEPLSGGGGMGNSGETS